MSKRFWNWKQPQETESEHPCERTLYLCGTIAEETWFDDEVTPAIFKEELTAGTGDITVWINSPGGDCIAAAQIYNMLMEYPGQVTIKIDGIAASAASVIAMAGTSVLMSPVATIMIHNPITAVYGDTQEMRRAAQMLSEVKESIINAYEIKTGMNRRELAKLMDAETWMNAHKAKELGFIDAILELSKITPEDMAAISNPATAMFDRKKVVNCLHEKLAKACHINTAKATPTEEESKPPKHLADEILKRLSFYETL